MTQVEYQSQAGGVHALYLHVPLLPTHRVFVVAVVPNGSHMPTYS